MGLFVGSLDRAARPRLQQHIVSNTSVVGYQICVAYHPLIPEACLCPLHLRGRRFRSTCCKHGCCDGCEIEERLIPLQGNTKDFCQLA